MEIADLRTFLVLSDELHFARAAARLYVSPARVSQVIGKLERELGGALFLRTSRRVQLMPLGAEFRGYVVEALAFLDRGVARARELAAGIDDVLQVGYQPVGLLAGAVGLASAYSAASPSSTLKLVAHHSGPDLTALVEMTVDAIMIWVPDGGATTSDCTFRFGRPLARARRHVVLGKGHPQWNRSVIGVNDLACSSLFDLDGALPGTGRSTRSARSVGQIPPQFTSIHDALAEVARGQGALLMTWLEDPTEGVPGMRAIEVEGLPSQTLRLVHRTSDRRPALMRLDAVAAAYFGDQEDRLQVVSAL